MRLVSDGEWHEVKLSDIAGVSMGQSPPGDTYNTEGEGLPFMQGRAEFGDRFPVTVKYCSAPKKIAQENDILLSVRAPVGDINIANKEIAIGRGLAAIRAKEKIDQRFLEYLLKGAVVNMKQVSSGSIFDAISGVNLKSLSLKIPNLKTQKKIAAILSSLDDRIEHNNNLARLLEENAQALYHSWFVRFDPVRAKERGEAPRGINPDQPMGPELANLFPDKIDSDTGIPQGWEEKSLSECASFLNGVAAQKHPPENNDFYPVLKIRELRAGGFNASDKASKNVPDKYIVKNGDIIFSWSASLLVDRWFGGEGVLNQHLFLVTPLCDLPEWFVYFANKNYLEHFQNLAAAKGTTMGHIKRGDLDLAKVVVPPGDILRLAESTIGELYNLSGQLREEYMRLAQTRDHLLPRLVSGKIDLGAAKEEAEKA